MIRSAERETDVFARLERNIDKAEKGYKINRRDSEVCRDMLSAFRAARGHISPGQSVPHHSVIYSSSTRHHPALASAQIACRLQRPSHHLNGNRLELQCVKSRPEERPPASRSNVRRTRYENPNPAYALNRMRAAKKAQVELYAANILPIIREVQAGGHTSCNAIAAQLNARKASTARGGRWTHAQVGQILKRVTISSVHRLGASYYFLSP